MSWDFGQVIVRRDVWRGRPWVGLPVHVVEDRSELLVTYMAEGSEIAIAPGDWPVVHPWNGRRAWSGHGVLMLHRPGDAYSVWVFWHGSGREFWGWYLNLQIPFVRTEIGFDTMDHELDLWSRDGATWQWKDLELLEPSVANGVLTAEEVEAIRAEAVRLEAEFTGGGGWWDEAWAAWSPPPEWAPARLPAGWHAASKAK